jgi:hypothetical protein
MKESVKIRSTRLSTNVEEWTVIYCDTAEEVEECITDPMLIWPILQKTVKRILDERRDSLPAAEIRCLEMVGSVWVTCRRSDIDTTLSKLLAWRERREEYEECAEIRDLLSEMYRIDEEDREVESAKKAASSAKPSSARRRRKL